MDLMRMYIDGEWWEAESKKTREINDPSTGELVAVVTEAGIEDTRRAIKAAHDAFPEWRKLNHYQRAALLNKAADLIEEDAAEIADQECRCSGRLLKYTTSDVVSICTILRYFAGIIGTPSGGTFNSSNDILTMTLWEPIGVCGIIVPWNAPINVAVKGIAPALAAGNTVVVKPSSITPLGTIKVFEAFEKAGFPKGVVNLVVGEGNLIGQEIGENDMVGKITFTGGTETGKDLIRASASNVKKLALELGGKSPIIIFDDADLDVAANNVIHALFTHSGQICIAGSRILVQDSVYDRFNEILVERVKKIKVGLSAEQDTEMGPLVSQAQMEKVLSYIEIGKKEGARLACGGKRISEGKFAKGYFVEPTVFLDCDNSMRIVREEIFGPVLVVGKFKTEEEAYILANDSIYGLGAGAFTSDVGRAVRFGKEVKATCLWVNSYQELAAMDASLSCCKQSGYSILMGTDCIKSYMDMKNLTIRHTVKKREWFSE